LDAPEALDLKISYPGMADRTVAVEPQSSPADLIHTSGTETRSSGLTSTGQVLNSPTINSGTFTGTGLTNPVATGGSWTNGTFISPAFQGAAVFPSTFRAMGTTNTGEDDKGGLYVGSDGGVVVGKNASIPASVPTATFVVNRTGGAGGSEGMVNFDWTNRAMWEVAGNPGGTSTRTDSAAMTLTLAEGDITGRDAPYEGPAGNLLGIENRLTLATYLGKIAQGHGGSRTVMGVGL